jgi:NAD(P)-dependent dehydrogenase (short-subunit alcohol dehydrogenase family)
MADSAANGIRLVVGASRGIGLALAQAQLADTGVRQVVATCRPTSDQRKLDRLARQHGDRLRRIDLDVTDPNSLRSFGEQLGQLPGNVDIAIHAAGMLHEDALQPEKSLADCNARNLLRMFEVNSIGPLMVARELLKTTGRRPFTFAALSAMVGSITDNRLGGWYSYRASKAALNQFIKTLAIECRFRHPGTIVLAIHPGTTDTDLSRPFQRNVKPGKLYAPEQTAARILEVIQNRGLADSGRFLSWDGSEIPW